MSFHHIDFLLAFPLFLISFWILPSPLRSFLLIGFNVLFYATWGAKYFLVVLFLCAVEWGVGFHLADEKTSESRKIFLYWIGMGSVLSTLIWFKYLGHDSQSSFLPVGLSYQVLMGLSYLTDLRFGRLTDRASFKDYILYKTFFPVVVAGPVTRFTEFVGHLKKPLNSKEVPWKEVIFLFSWGFFKKSYCADYLANEVVTPLTTNFKDYDTVSLLLGFVVMPIQVYCDFSGYSSMGKALAKSLGLDLPLNFNYPFLSNSFNEFWNRWHISLSHWLRDYIFFPMQKFILGYTSLLPSLVIAIFMTWFVGGVWHGAGAMYALYGVLQGTYVSSNAILDFYRSKALRAKKQKPTKKKFSIVHALGIFVLFAISILLFLSPDLLFFSSFCEALLLGSKGSLALDFWHPLFIILIVVCEHLYGFFSGEKVFDRLPSFVLGIVFASLWIYVLLVAPKNYVSFVYFKF